MSSISNADAALIVNLSCRVIEASLLALERWEPEGESGPDRHVTRQRRAEIRDTIAETVRELRITAAKMREPVMPGAGYDPRSDDPRLSEVGRCPECNGALWHRAGCSYDGRAEPCEVIDTPYCPQCGVPDSIPHKKGCPIANPNRNPQS